MLPLLSINVEREIERERDRCLRLWSMLELKMEISITFSKRLRVSLGRTDPENREIRLNPLLRTTARKHLKEVVCHELAHIVDFKTQKSTTPSHGSTWRRLMSSAGYVPRAMIRFDKPESARAVAKKYLYRCLTCQSRRIVSMRYRNYKCVSCSSVGIASEIHVETIA